MAGEKPKGYFVGEIEQMTPQGRLMVEVVASPSGAPMTQNQVQVEILNKLDAISSLINRRL